MLNAFAKAGKEDDPRLDELDSQKNRSVQRLKVGPLMGADGSVSTYL